MARARRFHRWAALATYLLGWSALLTVFLHRFYVVGDVEMERNVLIVLGYDFSAQEQVSITLPGC